MALGSTESPGHACPTQQACTSTRSYADTYAPVKRHGPLPALSRSLGHAVFSLPPIEVSLSSSKHSPSFQERRFRLQNSTRLPLSCRTRRRREIKRGTSQGLVTDGRESHGGCSHFLFFVFAVRVFSVCPHDSTPAQNQTMCLRTLRKKKREGKTKKKECFRAGRLCLSGESDFPSCGDTAGGWTFTQRAFLIMTRTTTKLVLQALRECGQELKNSSEMLQAFPYLGEELRFKYLRVVFEWSMMLFISVPLHLSGFDLMPRRLREYADFIFAWTPRVRPLPR